jgi:hypothetical protein
VKNRWVVGAIGALVFWGAVAEAQESEQAPVEAAQGVQARDMVRLKDGALFRGTISEFIPGEKVVIVTVAGAVREFPTADVSYAGPIGGESPATSVAPSEQPAPESRHSAEATRPEVTVEAPTARLRLESELPGVTFHRARVLSPFSSYQRLCTAPCSVTLPAGSESFALGGPDHTVRDAEPVVIPEGNSRVVGSFHSRQGIRIAGWALVGASVVAGTLAAILPRGEKQVCDYGGCRMVPDDDYAAMAVGVSVATAGLIGGFIMAMTRDVASVEVLPDSPLPEKRRWASPGITLAGKF